MPDRTAILAANMATSNDTVVYDQSDYASGPRRLIALAIDLCVCLMLLSMPLAAAKALWVSPDHWDDPDQAKVQRWFREDLGPARWNATIALAVLLPVGYQLAAGKLRGGTIGYRIARIRLIGHDGRPPTWKQLSVRTLASLLTFFTLGMVYLPTFKWKKRQAFHDRLAGTWMVLARAHPAGPGQIVYKTKLIGTYPLTFSDVESLAETSTDASAPDIGESAGAMTDPAS
jgi:uncharacterized RDD family membrane protein YckC